MIKSAIILRLAGAMPTLESLSEAVEARPFIACTPSQSSSTGFVPPRGQHEAMVEAIDGHWILRLKIESRPVPGAAVNKRAAELAAAVERETGRKPGKKLMKELKEQARHDLQPNAFSRETAGLIWIDPESQLMVVDGGGRLADEAAALLTQAIAGFALMPINTERSPSGAMSDWLLSSEPPAGFTVDGDTLLKQTDGTKASVRYTRHTLDLPEVQEHIKAGKTPTLLGMTWADRLSFTLTDGGHLKKIAILDGTESQKRDVDAFDADVAIMTGTMRPMLADLISALGGECRPAHADEGLYQRACDVVRTTGTAEPVALASALGVPSDTARALLRRMLDEELVAEESPGIYRAATDDVEA